MIHHLIPINYQREYVTLKFSHCFFIRSPLVAIGSHSLPFNIQWKTFPRDHIQSIYEKKVLWYKNIDDTYAHISDVQHVFKNVKLFYYLILSRNVVEFFLLISSYLPCFNNSIISRQEKCPSQNGFYENQTQQGDIINKINFVVLSSLLTAKNYFWTFETLKNYFEKYKTFLMRKQNK